MGTSSFVVSWCLVLVLTGSSKSPAHSVLPVLPPQLTQLLFHARLQPDGFLLPSHPRARSSLKGIASRVVCTSQGRRAYPFVSACGLVYFFVHTLFSETNHLSCFPLSKRARRSSVRSYATSRLACNLLSIVCPAIVRLLRIPAADGHRDHDHDTPSFLFARIALSFVGYRARQI